MVSICGHFFLLIVKLWGESYFYFMLGLEDENKAQWDKDKGIRQILNAVLTQNEIDEFGRIRLGKLALLQRKLEAKILTESQKLISGEELGAEALKQAELILEQVANVKISDSQSK